MTSSYILLLGAGLALTLAGVNAAFLLQLGGPLVGWFKFFIAAMTMTLIYIALSFSYGSPAGSRVAVGWAALIAETVAIVWMWYSIEVTRKRGHVGLVPLFRGEKGDPGAVGPIGPPGPAGPQGDPGRDNYPRSGNRG